MSSCFCICPFANSGSGKYVLWEITGECNMSCDHCLRGNSHNRSYTGDIIEAIEFFKRSEISGVLLTGGEPLLYPRLAHVVGSISKSGFEVGIYTNSTVVTEDIVKMLKKSGITYVILSINGGRKDTHDSIRGIGNFEKVCFAAKLFRNYEIDVDMTLTINSNNTAEIDDAISLAKMLKVDTLTITPILPIGNAKNINNDIVFNLEKLQIIAQNIEESTYNDRLLEVERVRLPLPGEIRRDNITCCMDSLIYINSRGNVGTCPWSGSIGRGMISDPNLSLKEKYYHAKRQADMVPKDKGCPLVSYLYYGNYDSLDPLLT